MSEAEIEFCPVHGKPGDVWAWPCPLGRAADPESDCDEPCPYFAAELQRRVKDVRAGNYFSLTLPDEDGVRWFIGHGRYEGEKRKGPSKR